MMTTLLLFIMLGITLALFKIHNNYQLILFASLFSFCAASLYFINAAPDLALAEMAIGCAFIPLVYTITIRRQNTFTVIFFSQNDKTAYCPPELLIQFMAITEAFCAEHQLKLRLITHPKAYDANARGIFKLGNTDLVANYVEEENTLKLWGNISNQLIPEVAHRLETEGLFSFEPMGGDWVDE